MVAQLRKLDHTYGMWSRPSLLTLSFRFRKNTFWASPICQRPAPHDDKHDESQGKPDNVKGLRLPLDEG